MLEFVYTIKVSSYFHEKKLRHAGIFFLHMDIYFYIYYIQYVQFSYKTLMCKEAVFHEKLNIQRKFLS